MGAFRFARTLLACSVCLPAAAPYAQWSQANGPWGPLVNALATDGASLFMMTNSYGIVQSRDRGDSWRTIGSGPEICVPCLTFTLAVRGDTVYAGSNQGVQMHAGAGSPWRQEKAGFGPDTLITGLAFGWGSLLAVTTTGGVYRSLDQGGTWTCLHPGTEIWTTGSFPSPNLAVDGDCAYIAENRGVLRSLDQGRTWSLTRPSAVDTIISIVVSVPPYVFAQAGLHTYRSRDSGATWSRLPAAPKSDSMPLFLNAIGSRLYAVPYPGNILFATSDGGDTWSRDSVSFRPGGTFFYGGIVGLGPDLFAGTVTGVFRSPDQGRTWQGAHTGIAVGSIEGLVSAGKGLLAALGHLELQVTADLGAHWRRVPAPHDAGIEAAAEMAGNLFILAPDTGIFRSGNGGGNWELLLGSQWSWDRPGRFFALGRELYYARSDEAGPTFALLQSDTNGGPGLPGWKGGFPRDMALGGGVPYALVSDSLLRYDPARREWRPTASTPVQKDMTVLGSRGTDLWVGTRNGGLFRSADSGATWMREFDSAAFGGVHALLSVGDTVFAGTDSGVAFSGRGGKWELLNQGLDSAPGMYRSANRLYSQDGYLFASIGSSGIWRFPLDGAGSGIIDRRSAPFRKTPARWTRVAGGIGFPRGERGPLHDANGRITRGVRFRP